MSRDYTWGEASGKSRTFNKPASAVTASPYNPVIAHLPGARLGPYEIVSALGVGGMGEVYRAHDPKLNRDVAIKVLLPAVANDPDRLARFSREAQVLASLNHPNIAAIYGLEESGDARALVMELVEGPTLADRIAQGSIPLDEALPIARQIAEALEVAHEQGIIHRDLKPANIKVRPDGTVKVLDFGLAKAIEPVTGSALANSPTITSPAAMTAHGVILGTAAYMPPEQARGRVVDKRADIWAFGGVLFEMLTGERAFKGEDLAETISSVMKSAPAWEALPRDVPVPVVQLLHGCLEKDARARIASISVARYVLSGQPLSAGTGRPEPSVAIRSTWHIGAGAAIVVLALLIAGAAGVVAWAPWRRAETIKIPVQFVVKATSGDRRLQTDLLVSSDGRWVVFTSGFAPQTTWARAVDELEPHALGSAIPLAFSPDSRELLASDRDATRLLAIEVPGGRTRTVAPLPASRALIPRLGAWSSRGVIYVSGSLGEVFSVPDAGGPLTRTPLVLEGQSAVARGTFSGQATSMQVLTDGEHVLFSGQKSDADVALGAYVGSLATGEVKLLVENASGMSEVGEGQVAFRRNDDVWIQPFDAGNLQLTGTPARLAVGPVGGLSWSRTGTLAYRPPMLDASDLAWFDRNGLRGATMKKATGAALNPAISPDGRRVAVNVRDGLGPVSIWIVEPGRNIVERLGASDQVAADPVWSPDGTQVAFMATAKGSSGLYVRRADGTGEAQRLATIEGAAPIATHWSPDGKTIVGATSDTVGRMWMYSMSDRKLQELPGGRFPRFSPDGHWLSFTSVESGRREVYLLAYPELDRRHRVSTDGGLYGQWRADGKELYYEAEAGGASRRKLMAVALTKAGTDLTPGVPRVMFELPTLGLFDSRHHWTTVDGEHFLVRVEGETPDTDGVVVVVNATASVAKGGSD